MTLLKKVKLVSIVILAITNSIFSMPIEMSSYTSSVNENNVELTWSTADQTLKAGFHIERRRNNLTSWAQVGFVQGHGTTNKHMQYSFRDAGLAHGTYYYRLKQVDSNGQFQYYDLSSPITIYKKCTREIVC
ncbi:MAG: hypothetical protein M3R36_04830 [Bacteroidota bacterium]|nr:hypothetical protein [Bacteroidota bacterium]